MFSIFVEAMGVKGRFSEHLKLLYFVICISKKKSVLLKRGKDEICSYDNFVLTSVSNPRQNVKCQKNAVLCPEFPSNSDINHDMYSGIFHCNFFVFIFFNVKVNLNVSFNTSRCCPSRYPVPCLEVPCPVARFPNCHVAVASGLGNLTVLSCGAPIVEVSGSADPRGQG